MVKIAFFTVCYTFFVLINTGLFCRAADEDRKTYIIYLGSLPEGEYSPESHHQSILQSVITTDSIPSEKLLVRSYKRSFNGFAAELTESERQTISKMEGVVSVFENLIYRPETTRSWDFIGLTEKVIRNPTVESDIIIGVLDTGIWPESDSFKDQGLRSKPKKWNGVCKGGQNFTCNNKLIGARFYSDLDGEMTARDVQGHGSHTASTAAGSTVRGASFLGIANGTARGAVPSSRIAVYKVCEPKGCRSSEILAGFDDAIADGVDVITASFGPSHALKLDLDSVAIGSFHAMKRGILTVNSAGNSGPHAATVSSVSPWLLSVAAATTDRLIITKVVLGNGKTLIGESVNTFVPDGAPWPLVYGKDVTSKCSEFSAQLCFVNCIDPTLVRGKIVVCDQIDGKLESFTGGAVGLITKTPTDMNSHNVAPFPTTYLDPENYGAIISYLQTNKNPRANILKSEEVKDASAPRVAWFSSRGPNIEVPDVMKPDITAPGVEIMAAYSPLATPSDIPGDKRHVSYSILSGTSMSCPHVAGVAAYVKSFHPDWSPSAIKSSIMTTATAMKHTVDDAEFAFGSGHVNPLNATNPGLVYEITEKDYINMLCTLNFTQASLVKISGDNTTKCDRQASLKGSPRDLNYPSVTAQVQPKKSAVVKFTRRVKNVGAKNSVYKATVLENFNRGNVTVTITPSELSFSSLNEEKSFEVSVSRRGIVDGFFYSASLVWSDGIYTVRSPIVVYTGRSFPSN